MTPKLTEKLQYSTSYAELNDAYPNLNPLTPGIQ